MAAFLASRRGQSGRLIGLDVLVADSRSMRSSAPLRARAGGRRSLLSSPRTLGAKRPEGACRGKVRGESEAALPAEPAQVGEKSWMTPPEWLSLGAVVLLVCACDSASLAPRGSGVDLEPERVDFGQVVAGELARQTFRLRNLASREVWVQGVDFEPARDAFAAFLQGGGTLNGAVLAPGQTVDVQLDFRPLTPGVYDTELRTGDDDLSLALPISARARPALEAAPVVEPTVLVFDAVPAGTEARRTLRLRNVGERSARVSSLQTSHPAFGWTPRPNSTVEAGASVDLVITYRPTGPDQADEGEAQVVFDNGASASVVLYATSVRPGGLDCPQDRVDFGPVTRGDRAVRTVTCRRTDPGWVFASADLDDGDNGFGIDPSPFELGADVWSFDVVFDAQGAAGQRDDVLRLVGEDGTFESLDLRATLAPPAPGTVDMFLELTWSAEGSDFDLHVVRAEGRPFVPADDCYFESKNPAWGGTSASDDPFLDQDARRGPGPEVVNLHSAAEPYFDVFVQYHGLSSEGQAASTSEVELRWSFRDGGRGALNRQMVRCGDWWHVGRVDRGPPFRFESVDTLSQAYRDQAHPSCR